LLIPLKLKVYLGPVLNHSKIIWC